VRTIFDGQQQAAGSRQQAASSRQQAASSRQQAAGRTTHTHKTKTFTQHSHNTQHNTQHNTHTTHTQHTTQHTHNTHTTHNTTHTQHATLPITGWYYKRKERERLRCLLLFQHHDIDLILIFLQSIVVRHILQLK
jgi:hypothetical protein